MIIRAYDRTSIRDIIGMWVEYTVYIYIYIYIYIYKIYIYIYIYIYIRTLVFVRCVDKNSIKLNVNLTGRFNVILSIFKIASSK